MPLGVLQKPLKRRCKPGRWIYRLVSKSMTVPSAKSCASCDSSLAVSGTRTIRAAESGGSVRVLVPPELAEGLTDASPGELSDVRVLGPGTTIEWPQLDVQFSVTGLIMGIFGTQAGMADLGAGIRVAL